MDALFNTPSSGLALKRSALKDDEVATASEVVSEVSEGQDEILPDLLQAKRRRRSSNRHQAFEFKEISQPGAEFRKKLENERLMLKVRLLKVYSNIF